MSEFQNNCSVFDQDDPQAPSSAQQAQSGIGTSPATAQPAPAPWVRRVGTLTMGIALILTGCAIAVSLIWPSFDLSIVFRLCPLLLISLGCEVLVSSFAKGSVRLKYDLVSMFLCTVLIILSLCLSMVPLAVRYFGPEYRISGQQIADELDRTAYQLLAKDKAVADCSANVCLSPLRDKTAVSADELTDADKVYLSVNLYGPYTDAAAFVADCVRVRDALLSGISGIDSLYFDCTFASEQAEGGEQTLSLSLPGPFQLNASPEELVQLVEVY